MSLMDTIRELEEKAANQHYERIKEELLEKIKSQPYNLSYLFKVSESEKLTTILKQRFIEDGLIVSSTFNHDLYSYHLCIKIPH
jgi:hypothetical protein